MKEMLILSCLTVLGEDDADKLSKFADLVGKTLNSYLAIEQCFCIIFFKYYEIDLDYYAFKTQTLKQFSCLYQSLVYIHIV